MPSNVEMFNYMNKANRCRVSKWEPVIVGGHGNVHTSSSSQPRGADRKKSNKERPRLFKVRDGSVTERLASFAFNPGPHFECTWSILHLLLDLAVRFACPCLAWSPRKRTRLLSPSFSHVLTRHFSFPHSSSSTSSTIIRTIGPRRRQGTIDEPIKSNWPRLYLIIDERYPCK